MDAKKFQNPGPGGGGGKDESFGRQSRGQEKKNSQGEGIFQMEGVYGGRRRIRKGLPHWRDERSPL